MTVLVLDEWCADIQEEVYFKSRDMFINTAEAQKIEKDYGEFIFRIGKLSVM